MTDDPQLAMTATATSSFFAIADGYILFHTPIFHV